MSVDKAQTHSPNILYRAGNTKAILRENYYADSRPWVIAFSEGKDSTLVLQLVYEMMIELGIKSHEPVYVLSNDTLVESPRIGK
jgi:DNA sulfur modification protein DndC